MGHNDSPSSPRAAGIPLRKEGMGEQIGKQDGVSEWTARLGKGRKGIQVGVGGTSRRGRKSTHLKGGAARK